MSKKDIVVIGASAGGVEAVRAILSALPADFPGSVFVVQHTAPDAPNLLPRIFARDSRLGVGNPFDGDEVQPGRVYVAPPDHHLILERGGAVRLTQGPKENRFRPAVDPLFRSAARAYGARVVGVILSGGMDDGTTGLLAVKQQGGAAVVQDPEEALVPSMPRSALQHVKVDYCLPLAEIGPLLARLAAERAEERSYPVSEELEIEVKIAMQDRAVDAGVTELGEPSSFACPDCHGVLLKLKAEGPMRFRCHTGHAYTADSLLSGVNENVDGALWNSIRTLEEGELLLRHMVEHLGDGQQHGSAADLLRQADDLRRRAELVRQAAFLHAPQGAD